MNCSIFGNKRAEPINLTCLTLVTREVRFFKSVVVVAAAGGRYTRRDL